MKALKMLDVLCTSPASTSVCMSVEHRSMVKQSSRVLEKTKLLDGQDSEILGPNRFPGRSRASDRQHHLSGEHGWDQQKLLQRPRYQRRDHNGSTSKNRLAANGPLDQKLSTMLPVQSSVQPLQSSSSEQAVVMKVSLHCQGCAGKVRKHLSKMQGVTSFTIDLEKQKVTVIGDVSPSGVLESISKVKNAEFWPVSSSL